MINGEYETSTRNTHFKRNLEGFVDLIQGQTEFQTVECHGMHLADGIRREVFDPGMSDYINRSHPL